MSDIAESPAKPLDEGRARGIIRNSMAFGYMADNLDKPCSCNACVVCAATFLVKLQSQPRGPIITVHGWRVGMQKMAIGRTLVRAGVPVGESFRTVNHILNNFRQGGDSVFNDGPSVQIQVAEGVNVNELVAELRDCGLEIRR